MDDNQDESNEARTGFHRHTNPDGTEGGWVSDEAHVAKTVFVGRDATVEKEGRVKGRARLLGKARVSGNVEGDAVICDEAYVSYGSTVKGSAVLSGRAAAHGPGSVVEGYTHLHNVEISGLGFIVSGGEFKGKPTMLGSTQLWGKVDDAGHISQLFLWSGKEEPLPHADELLKHVTTAEKHPPARDTRER